MYGLDYDVRRVTLQDCIEMYIMKNESVILNDGQVIGFEEDSD